MLQLATSFAADVKCTPPNHFIHFFKKNLVTATDILKIYIFFRIFFVEISHGKNNGEYELDGAYVLPSLCSTIFQFYYLFFYCIIILLH